MLGHPANNQSYLLSIRPFLTPRPTPKALHERGPVPSTSASASGSASSSTPAGLDKSDQGIATAQTQSSEQDEVFHWGREMDVNWRMVAWVTARDQVGCLFASDTSPNQPAIGIEDLVSSLVTHSSPTHMCVRRESKAVTGKSRPGHRHNYNRS